eukprot:5323770-Prymnesium_polylepis.1
MYRSPESTSLPACLMLPSWTRHWPGLGRSRIPSTAVAVAGKYVPPPAKPSVGERHRLNVRAVSSCERESE